MHRPNKYKVVFIFILLFLSVDLSAQFGINRETRAVIVGISDYEDELIPDLNFAHKDAQAFKDYLTSDAGGNVTEENIKLLTNDEATGGNVHKALYWLLKSSNENDNAIIYFSGHGDVETIYADEPGHLLIYDSPSSIYQINSIRIEDLQRIINTLSNQKKSNVSVFTDACRSGKLAGSEVKGAQATAAALNNQFANEIKLMSCQPNEYSVEGESWGGGRGVFSYYLIEGLIGLADTDENHEVSLREIERYLDDQLAKEDFKQTPVAIGDKNTKVAYVDETALAAISADELQADVGDLAVNVLKNGQGDLLDLFYEAIKNDFLLEAFLDSENQDAHSAEYYYDLILEDSNLESKVPIIKGDFISALQDDAQHAINLYLKADSDEMKKRWYGESHHFESYPKYLGKAASLLGESNYLFPQVKAKEIYFDVVSQRIELDRKKADKAAYANLETQLMEAINYQIRSPFIYNELGLVQKRQGNFEEALSSLNTAIEMSPHWPLPYNNKSQLFNLLGRYQEAIEMANHAIGIDSSFSGSLANLAQAYSALGKHEESLKFYQQNLELHPDNCLDLSNVGSEYLNMKNYQLAKEFSQKAIDCDESNGIPYLNMGMISIREARYDDALSYLSKAKERNLNIANLYNTYGICYEELEQNDKAKENYLIAIEKNPKHEARLNIAMLYLKTQDADQAIKHFDYYIDQIESDYKYAYFDLACAHALNNNLEGFEKNLRLAIEYGFTSKKEMEESTYLSSIRTTAKYAELISLLK